MNNSELAIPLNPSLAVYVSLGQPWNILSRNTLTITYRNSGNSHELGQNIEEQLF